MRATLFACALVVCGAVALSFSCATPILLYDDALYIYFRYVENLFGGCGLQLQLRRCGLGRGIHQPASISRSCASRGCSPPTWSTASTNPGRAAPAWRPRSRSPSPLRCIHDCAPRSPLLAALSAAAVTVALAFDHRLLVNAATGLETSLACLAVAVVFRLALTDRPPIAASLLAILVRPELAVLVAARCSFGRRPAAARPLALIAAALVAMTATRFILFHDLLPNTFWAKSGGTRAHLRLGLEYTYETVCDFSGHRAGTAWPVPAGTTRRRATIDRGGAGLRLLPLLRRRHLLL